MSMAKILYGICGIGNGHLFRQLPILQALCQTHEIIIFTYGDALNYLRKNILSNTRLIEVAVPFYVGTPNGLDFSLTLQHNNCDFFTINTAAMAYVQEQWGKPDIVLSDYEPVSAQYAYAYNAPFITIDQQSKYLLYSDLFPHEIDGLRYIDEQMRLRMFFPVANERIACSFFNVPSNDAHVTIVGSTIRNTIKAQPLTKKTSIVVYLSKQMNISQSLDELIGVMSKFSNTDFNIFVADNYNVHCALPNHIKVYSHGHPDFTTMLASSHGVIATAGHSLLSECMVLGKPVYALSLDVYEQKLNAYVIEQFKLGCSNTCVDVEKLKIFIDNLKLYTHNIVNDNQALIKVCGVDTILNKINSYLS